MLNEQERKEKIIDLTNNLSGRFSEQLYNHPSKIAKMKKYKPSFLDEVFQRWDELDRRFQNYLAGTIEWNTDLFGNELDVQSYACEFYCWFGVNVEKLS